MKNILIIDDEIQICQSIEMILEYEDYEVDFATDANEGLNKLRSFNFDALLLDIQMPEMSGFEILKRINDNKIDVRTIIISAHSSLENAVKATKLGAYDFIEKPIDRDKLLISIRNAVAQSNLIKENRKLRNELVSSDTIIGNSKAIKDIIKTIDRVARTEARILITGENGTGKELVAKAIHRNSDRSEKELVEVNCAAIPNELIESELFGHEKGSFTGAHKDKTGKFEKAHKGTLFLDEVGDMSLQAQAKVLRAIEEGKIERVGGTDQISVDVRIISATNKNLIKEIEEGRFREDLFHRLNVIPIHVPPLRERKDDIPVLVDHFLEQVCKKNNFPKKLLDKDAVEYLQKLEWKGNIRELRNLIERVIIMVPANSMKLEDVRKHIPSSGVKEDDLMDVSNSFQEFKEKAEKAFIRKQLEANGWNISKTADILGIQRSHLYGKIKKYNLERD